MTMEQKLVAFIDILGFSKLIERYDSGETYILTELKDAVDPVSSFLRDKVQIKEFSQTPFFDWKDCLSVRLFSDCLCVAAPLSYKTYEFYEQLNFFYKYLMGFQIGLMEKGFFIRGAVTIGSHYIDENMIFSGGLVEAYNLEKEKAKYPRIIISEKLIKEIKKIESLRIEELDYMIIIDNSETMFFNHFNYNLIDSRFIDKMLSNNPLFKSFQGIIDKSYEELDEEEKIKSLKKIKEISTLEIVNAQKESDSGKRDSIINKHRWLIDFIDFELKISNKHEFKTYKNWR